MEVDFESAQIVQIYKGDYYSETEFSIGLKCTIKSSPGWFDPRVGGEPPSGPEFELVSISLYDPKVNSHWSITWEQLVIFVGEDIAQEILDKAWDDAAESGDF